MDCLCYFANSSHRSGSDSQTKHHAVIKKGVFLRRSDGHIIQRYFCRTCQRTFSKETASPFRYQKKRHFNDSIYSLLASGISQRRMAKLLSINKKTVVRKFLVLGKICLNDLASNKHLPKRKITEFQFDDMETFEHTKMKPLSISLVVESKTRLILGFRVSQMKAKGHLAMRARKKYGFRMDERKKHWSELLKQIRSFTEVNPTIKSDMNPHYPPLIKSIFPNSRYIVYKGRRGCIVGQGELKSGGFDPLFSFNHTAAMLRANINRLFRRTWNTTKNPICLSYHIAIYIFYHNLRLLKQPDKHI